MVTCDDLVAFADGELGERADAFRDHLRSCEACRVGLVDCLQLTAQLSCLPPRPARQRFFLFLKSTIGWPAVLAARWIRSLWS